MKIQRRFIKVLGIVGLYFVISSGMIMDACSSTAIEIDASVQVALERFTNEIKDGQKLINDAKGVLVFPKVYKAGVGVGGEYGEGALQIKGKTVDYYNTAAGSFGFQLGAQKKSIILLFMQEEVLNDFRNSTNWKAGVDASIAFISVGADGSIDTSKINKPIIAFAIGQKGLMYNLTLEGAKITKLNKSPAKEK